MNSNPSSVILPGSTLGIVGGGQLGRMFCIAAKQMGYKTVVFSDVQQGPASFCSDQTIHADYADAAAIAEFCSSCDAVTFETEKLPHDVLQKIADKNIVRPGIDFLYLTQNRIREKTGLSDAGLPVGDCHPVRSEKELSEAIQKIGNNGILKTAEGGYDGKGQVRITQDDDPSSAWGQLGKTDCIFEKLIDFQCEFSVIAARSASGQVEVYPPVENHHTNHVLDLSYCPARIDKTASDSAIDIAKRLADSFSVVGVFCIEFFLTNSGEVLINEIAPRPHNSGHLTIEASATNQFQQQVRCLCGLPPGKTDLLRPVVMANLLGDLWNPVPNWGSALQGGDVQLHLYEKASANPGRKMGHLVVTADDLMDAEKTAIAARENLQSSSS